MTNSPYSNGDFTDAAWVLNVSFSIRFVACIFLLVSQSFSNNHAQCVALYDQSGANPLDRDSLISVICGAGAVALRVETVRSDPA